jgi:hypothetical protein
MRANTRICFGCKKFLKKNNFLSILTLFAIVIFLINLNQSKNFQLHVIGNSDMIDHEEEFILKPENNFCNTKSMPLLFIVFVVIAPQYFEKRQLIRATRANKSISTEFRVIFTVGSSKNETINRMIKNEHESSKDMLQMNQFIDSYYNLTRKIMKSLKWVSSYCSNAKYILRINDDVVVNTPLLINHFKSLPYETNQLFGFGLIGVAPFRSKYDKFYVSEKEFPYEKYDDFVEGSHIFSILF